MEYKEIESKQNDINCVISTENVNIGHQPEIDYLKAILIYLMINDHVYFHYSHGCIILNQIMDFIIHLFGAGGFMLLMGFGMKYSKHHEPKNYISRGIVLLTQGQYINIIRDCLPNLIAYWITWEKIFISRALLVLTVDILHFSGIAFCLLALLKKIKLSDFFILIISIIMNIVNLLLSKKMKFPNNFLLSSFLGYFVMTDAESYFPLFSYFIFVAFGYWLGGIYQKINDKNNFYNLILIICPPILILYYIVRSFYDFPFLPKHLSDKHYSLYPFPDCLLSCMFNLTILAISYKIDKLFKGKTPVLITYIGKNMNDFYIISYLLLIYIKSFLIITRGEDSPSQMNFPIIFSFVLFVLSKILIDINNKYIHFTIINLKNPLRNYVFALIWITTIIILIFVCPKVEFYTTIWNNYME